MAGISQLSKLIEEMWGMYKCRHFFTNLLYVQHLFVYKPFFLSGYPQDM